MSYTVNEHGTITDLGKFEGEPRYAPYYWNQGLDGAWNEDENGVYFFILDADDYKRFPELQGEYGVAVEESEQGFVRTTTFSTREGYLQSVKRCQEDSSGESEDESE